MTKSLIKKIKTYVLNYKYFNLKTLEFIIKFTIYMTISLIFIFYF